MASDNTSTPLLPGFQWGGGDRVEAFYDALWSHNSDGGLIEASLPCEPPGLVQLMETSNPDDTWLGSNPTEEDAMAVDSPDGSDSDNQAHSAEATSTVRYIDLPKHPALDFEALSLERFLHHDCATYIVRDEYRVFMNHVLARLHVKNSVVRFFLTGQPGIGKS